MRLVEFPRATSLACLLVGCGVTGCGHTERGVVVSSSQAWMTSTSAVIMQQTRPTGTNPLETYTQVYILTPPAPASVGPNARSEPPEPPSAYESLGNLKEFAVYELGKLVRDQTILEQGPLELKVAEMYARSVCDNAGDNQVLGWIEDNANWLTENVGQYFPLLVIHMLSPTIDPKEPSAIVNFGELKHVVTSATRTFQRSDAERIISNLPVELVESRSDQELAMFAQLLTSMRSNAQLSADNEEFITQLVNQVWRSDYSRNASAMNMAKVEVFMRRVSAGRSIRSLVQQPAQSGSKKPTSAQNPTEQCQDVIVSMAQVIDAIDRRMMEPQSNESDPRALLTMLEKADASRVCRDSKQKGQKGQNVFPVLIQVIVDNHTAHEIVLRDRGEARLQLESTAWRFLRPNLRGKADGRSFSTEVTLLRSNAQPMLSVDAHEAAVIYAVAGVDADPEFVRLIRACMAERSHRCEVLDVCAVLHSEGQEYCPEAQVAHEWYLGNDINEELYCPHARLRVLLETTSGEAIHGSLVPLSQVPIETIASTLPRVMEIE
jgi:hypothetical protein